MKDSKIQWCDHTFNPWEGCTKVSPGCINCYAENRNARFGGGVAPNWGPGKPRRRTSAANWQLPRIWNAVEEGVMVNHEEFVANRRPRVFCASLADWLDDEVPVEWLADLLLLIHQTPNLDWLLLTKRPELWRSRIEKVAAMQCDRAAPDGICADGVAIPWLEGFAPPNVWIGTSAEDQPRLDQRVPHLLNIPAKVRFISAEPLLGPLTFDTSVRIKDESCTKWPIDWVIVGGESGPNARPMVVEWAYDIRLQCEKTGAAFFMKQLGKRPATSNVNALDWPDSVRFHTSGWMPGAGAAEVFVHDPKGGDIEQFPTELQVRQFPEVRS